MIEIVIAAAIVLMVVFLSVRKKKTAGRAVFAPAPKPVTPVKSEAVVDANEVQQAVVEPIAPVVAEPKKTVVTVENTLLPQDSVLKRHYLHYVHSMVTELHSAPPSEATLLRHYNSDIAAKVAECVTNEAALQQLILAYDAAKPVVTQVAQIVEPVVTAEPVPVAIPSAKVVRIPEDSMLRRHYLTQIHALAAAKLPARPSDSTLRRHYDTLLAQEVTKQLAVS